MFASFAVFGLLITLGEAIAYVLSGMYGDVAELGAANAILIIVQLFVAGVIVIVLVWLLVIAYVSSISDTQTI